MSLCDNCITVLKDDLSEEAIQILNKIELFNELSERDLVRKLSLNHKHVKKLLYELEVKLLLTYESYGRTKAYHLTKNGSRLLRLEEDETEIEVDFRPETEDEIINSNNLEEQTGSEVPSQNEVEPDTTAVKNNNLKQNNESDESDEEEKKTEETTASKKSENLVWDFK